MSTMDGDGTPAGGGEALTPPTPPGTGEPPDLGRRFASFRTLFSFVVAFALLGFFLYKQGPDTLADSWAQIRGARPWRYLAAIVAYYTAFPIRALRWRLLLRNSGEPAERLPSLRALSEIIYLSWFANSIVPAKLGDVYRGWLLRRQGGATWSHAMGTIVAERMLDLVVLVTLMVVTGFVTYGQALRSALAGSPLACLRGGIHTEAISCTLLQLFAVGGLGAIAIVIGLVVFARFGTHLERLLPERLADVYIRFSGALVLSFGQFGPLLALSILAWMAEGTAFWFVGLSLGIHLPLPLVIFFSLLQAFITVIPLTPGGLGFEILLAGALSLRGFGEAEAWAMTGLYRSITYLSLIVGGAILYAIVQSRPDGNAAGRTRAMTDHGTHGELGA